MTGFYIKTVIPGLYALEQISTKTFRMRMIKGTKNIIHVKACFGCTTHGTTPTALLLLCVTIHVKQRTHDKTIKGKLRVYVSDDTGRGVY